MHEALHAERLRSSLESCLEAGTELRKAHRSVVCFNVEAAELMQVRRYVLLILVLIYPSSERIGRIVLLGRKAQTAYNIVKRRRFARRARHQGSAPNPISVFHFGVLPFRVLVFGLFTFSMDSWSIREFSAIVRLGSGLPVKRTLTLKLVAQYRS